jgi:putative aminopeptidase FrvX
MSKEKLKDILSTPTYCGQEQYLIAKITRYLSESNLDYVVDEHGNIYVTKGVADFYPCVVAHTDSVHRIVEMDILEREDDEEILYAVEKGTNKPTGCGGDNKAGVYVCLELLERVEIIKAAFFVSEEYGCFGSILSDETFFENVDKTTTSKSLDAYLKINFGTGSNISDNVRLNNAFRAADKNKNGVISEDESIAYVQSLIRK